MNFSREELSWGVELRSWVGSSRVITHFTLSLHLLLKTSFVIAFVLSFSFSTNSHSFIHSFSFSHSSSSHLRVSVFSASYSTQKQREEHKQSSLFYFFSLSLIFFVFTASHCQSVNPLQAIILVSRPILHPMSQCFSIQNAMEYKIAWEAHRDSRKRCTGRQIQKTVAHNQDIHIFKTLKKMR